MTPVEQNDLIKDGVDAVFRRPFAETVALLAMALALISIAGLGYYELQYARPEILRQNNDAQKAARDSFSEMHRYTIDTFKSLSEEKNDLIRQAFTSLGKPPGLSNKGTTTTGQVN